MEERKCFFCNYFSETIEDEGVLSPIGFGFCRRLKIHEGEMYDASRGENRPDVDTDIVICTSEWFQYLMVNIDFGCVLFNSYKE